MTAHQDSADVLKKAAAVIQQLKSRIDNYAQLEQLRSEPIAIIGMGCRFPGAAVDPEAFFALLDAGQDAVRELAERWAQIGYAPPDDVPRWAGLLDEVASFDAEFFGISPREATSLDPQQRLLLEVAWEALEDAGVPVNRLPSTRTGVFLGACTADYLRVLDRLSPAAQEAYRTTGNMLSIAAGRLAYTFGFQGPCLTIDTACSSSLVAAHLACRSLRDGECSIALVAGVNLLLYPEAMESLTRIQALSPDGCCRTFDAGANGYVRGEGCGVIVLKRLSEALRDGDRIHALIRGSAVNQDGRSTGLTAPNVLAQQALLREALASAGIEASRLGYIEVHGTGTPLGDPIEVEALQAVFGQPRADGSRCVLGAVKTNIGHLEGAAGVAGLIKAVLALEKQRIPRNLNFRTLNPRIRLDGSALVLATETVPWPRSGQPRFAGVSSFGLSGTNAHVVLQEAPRRADAEGPRLAPADPVLLPLSARSRVALQAQAARLAAHLATHPELRAADLAFTAATRRSQLPYRLAVVGRSPEELQQLLTTHAAAEPPPGLGQGRSRPGLADGRGGVVFLYPGQGAQYPGMGQDLYRAWPAFREALDRCAQGLHGELPRPLLEVMWAEKGTPAAALLDQTVFTQPALFALGYALAALWRSCGIAPDYALGHSVGELAAACGAGVFSLSAALKLVAARARLMQALPPGGAMVSLQMSEAELRAAIGDQASRLAVAASNAPDQVVLSGDEDAVLALAAALQARGIRSKRLAVSHAFHSPRVEAMQAEFRRVAESIAYQRPEYPIVSNVTGELAGGELATAAYWVAQVRAAVRFSAGVAALHREGCDTFVEAGPQSTLLTFVAACLPAAQTTRLASLHQGRDEQESFLKALAGWYVVGRELDWQALHAAPRRIVPLPTYPFQRQRYWLAPASPRPASPGGWRGRWSLSGEGQALPGGVLHHVLQLDPARQHWLAEHRVHDRIVLAGAFHLCTVLAIAAEQWPAESVTLRSVSILQPIEVDRPTALHVVLRPGPSAGTLLFSIAARLPGARAGDADPVPSRESAVPWKVAVEGTLQRGAAEPVLAAELGPLLGDGQTPLGLAAAQTRMQAAGIVWGERWMRLQALAFGPPQARGSNAYAEILGVVSEEAPLHPAVLDNAFLAALLALQDEQDMAAPRLPLAVELLRFYRSPRGNVRCRARVCAAEKSPERTTSDLLLIDETDTVVAEILGFTACQVPRERFLTAARSAERPLRFTLDWTPRPLPVAAPAAGRWLIWAADAARGAALRLRLEAEGREVLVTGDALDLTAAGELAGIVCDFVTAPTEDESATARRLLGGALRLLQALAARPTVVPMWWLTQCAYDGSVAGPLSPAQASLWGLGRAWQQEHVDKPLTLIDLDTTEPQSWPLALLSLAVAPPEAPREPGAWVPLERQWRLQQQRLLGPRLVSLPVLGDAGKLPGPGTILVTGGLGGLGLQVARLLVERGATHLLLTGRRGLSTPEATASVMAMRALGADVTVAALDVADRDAVAALLAAIPAERPLCGIVHAAGVRDDGVITAQQMDRFTHVLAPKVDGAWHLHELTRGYALEFFLMFSSLAGVLGSAGQGSYAAANAFLDGLARLRRSQGLPALSLQWGPWAGAGMAGALPEAARTRMARQGIELLAAEQALAQLAALLPGGGDERAELTIAAIDPARLNHSRQSAHRPAGSPGGSVARAQADVLDASLAARLARLPVDERRRLLRELVREEAARVLGLQSPQVLAPDVPFRELGLDSLMALELHQRLEERADISLPATLVFDHPQVDAAAEFLLLRMGPLAEKPAPAASSSTLAASSSAPTPEHAEPIAIVGMGCRFPGNVNDPESFWRLLDEGVDAITEVPPERWRIADWYDPDPTTPGKMVTRSGGFLRQIDLFDAGFFGIAPREAEKMDPQQRLLLEVSWEALERAGICPERLMGQAGGVFVGLMYQDYAALVGGPKQLDGYVSTGNSGSVASGRISYLLGLKGPSMTVDTACSSSLVTLHLACQSLRAGECSLALAGGVALMLTPAPFVEFSRLRGLAPDGRCKSFDAAADGVAWSEGCAMLVLKRLGDAQRDGDPILAVVRGTAVNQDGRSNGLTAPNGPAQEEVIRRALAQAAIVPSQVDYIECHGTGTALGDPIEVQALGAVFAAGREQALQLGSVKTNLGHTQAAAGVAGVMKVVLAMRHGRIPKNLHFKTPSPHIPWRELPVAVVTEPVPWRRGSRPRIAGVSSFGVSGTNAHVVIEEPSAEPTPAPAVAQGAAVKESAVPAPVRAAELILLSSKSQGALDKMLARLRDHVATHDTALGDLAFTLATTRPLQPYRAALSASSRDALCEALTELISGPGRVGISRGHAAAAPRIVFVFPGQGAQWIGMGRTLLAEEPVFRAALESCDRAIQSEAGWSPLAALQAAADDSRLAEIDRVQPLLFAVAVALAALWQSWGIAPDAIVGHSMGEVAASYVAGALSLEDAVKVICRRSRLMRSLSGQGEMALVELTPSEAEAALVGLADRLSVAVINGSRSTVLSGEPRALAAVLAALEQRQVFYRRIKVDVASHSPQVDVLREPLLTALAELAPRPVTIPLFSTVNGLPLSGHELVAGYWVDNLRQPVRFADAVQRILDERSDRVLFIEVSPHPVLLPAVEELLRERAADGAVVGSLRREQPERQALLESLGTLFVQGCRLDTSPLFPQGARVELPTYPFERQRYWVETPPPEPASRENTRAHPLLGAAFDVAALPDTTLWESRLGVTSQPWLADHVIHGATILPAAAYLELALAAGTEAFAGAPFAIHDVEFERMWVLSEPAGSRLQVALKSDSESAGAAASLTISSRAPSSWQRHARATLQRFSVRNGPIAAETQVNLDALRERCPQQVDVEALYQSLSARGMVYGPRFRGIVSARCGTGEAVACVALPESCTLAGAPLGRAGGWLLHPALLDACLQVAVLALGGFQEDDPDPRALIPVAVGRVRLVRRPAGPLFVQAQLGPGDGSAAERTAALRLFDESGRLVAELDALRMRRVGAEAVPRPAVAPAAVPDVLSEWLFALAWRRLPTLAPKRMDTSAAAWLVLCDRGGTGSALVERLVAQGARCIVVQAGPGFTRLAPDRFCVDPAQPDAMRTLLREAFAHGSSCRGAIHLWSLDGAAADSEFVPSSEVLERELTLGSLSALQLAQGLLRAAWRDPPRLWLVTRGVHPVGDVAVTGLSQAPLWGLGRVLALEHPELGCTRIDLAPLTQPAGVSAQAAELLAELTAEDAEDQLALRETGRFGARLHRYRSHQEAPAAAAVRLKEDASYLITGGLGGLGLTVASWLVERGARHLALVGRSAPSASAQQVLAQLQAAGVQVEVLHADVAVTSEVAAVLDEIRRRLPPLRGLVHAAGVLSDATIAALDGSHLRAVLEPKAWGAWNLHTLTAGLALDFFVLYSSAAGLLGSPGQGNYAAANAFLDTLAHHRRGRGLPGLSINWGTFAEVGLAATSARRGERLALRGIEPLTPEQGLRALERVWDAPRAQLAVIKFDLRRWMESYPVAAASPLWETLRSTTASTAPAARGQLQVLLRQAAPEQQQALLETHLAGVVAQVLRLDPRALDRQAPFTTLGMDSLMGLEIRNRLELELGERLPAALVFTYPTLRELAACFVARFGQGVVGQRPDQAQARPAAHPVALEDPHLAETLASLSVTQKENMLDSILGDLEIEGAE